MAGPVGAEELRQNIREIVRQKFAELVASVRSGRGSLSEVAAQVGVRRQMLDQYAAGSVPASDVLLAALLKWDWVIRIDMPGMVPAWCEFSLSDMDGGPKSRRRQPVQLSLFDALTDLDQNITALKKSVGRAEMEIERALGIRT